MGSVECTSHLMFSLHKERSVGREVTGRLVFIEVGTKRAWLLSRWRSVRPKRRYSGKKLYLFTENKTGKTAGSKRT